jgi:hypothetical protein
MLQEKLEPIIYGQPAMITTRASFRELPSCFSLDPLDTAIRLFTPSQPEMILGHQPSYRGWVRYSDIGYSYTRIP